MIQATTAIGDFMLILLTTAFIAAAQLGGMVLLAIASGTIGARYLWRRRHP